MKNKKIKKFYCIGDSITNGARNEFHRDYVLELNYLFRNSDVIFLNDSVNGETTSEILKRTIKVIIYNNPDGIFFLGGTNDSKIPIPFNIFEKNIKTLISICKKKKVKLFLGLIPKIYSGLPAYSQQNGNLTITKYNNLIKIIAKSEKVPLVDLSKLDEKFFIDGIHTSNKGCEKIAKLIKNIINKI